MKPIESIFRSFAEYDAEAAARALEELPPGEAAQLIVKYRLSVSGPVFERLSPLFAGSMLEHLGRERAVRLLRGMEPGHSAALLRNLDGEKREGILKDLPDQAERHLRSLLQHSAETAGGMMDPQVTTIPHDATVAKAIQRIRQAQQKTLHYLYVTDGQSRLVGVIGTRDLLLADPKDVIEKLMSPEVTKVPSDMDSEEVTQVFQEKRYLALPVVDEEGRLLGVVRQNQVLQAAREEAFEDMQRMVGGGEEHALSPVSVVVKRRLPWLMVNLLTAFLAAAVVGLFEGVIAKVTALAVLLPVVAGQGGNTGAQSLAIVIRGLALKEIRSGASARILLKEFFGATLNGVSVAIVTALTVIAWYGSLPLACVIFLAMIVNMSAAGLSGAAIPLILKKMGRDPAQSSSIFLTTVTDVVGFASFLGLAMLFQPWLENMSA